MNETEKRGRQASVDGFAHEHITTGILMKKYQNVSLRDWKRLKSYFSIPENIKDIDFEKIKLNKQGKLVKYEKNMVLPLFDQKATNSR